MQGQSKVSKFSQKITELTKPLRELLKVDNAWICDTAQENAFQQIKHELASSGTLNHYDPSKESIASADASSFGIGTVIRQKRGESLRPVAYASRSMSDTEMRYAQIVKEALVITLACEKFSNYLIGTKFKLENDHKPLVSLLSTKDLAELPARIQRFKMRLMRFDFSISHIAGKDLNIADTLSRAPVENMSQSDTDFENETQAFVVVAMSNLPASQNRIELIKTESAKDERWPEKSKLDERLRPITCSPRVDSHQVVSPRKVSRFAPT